jgi:cytochrome c
MPALLRFLVISSALAACTADAAAAGPDIANGKLTFTAMCSVCHATTPTGGPTLAPNLLGVVGRPAGSEPGFAQYTPALKASGITWSTKTLDQFLVNPMAKVPGTAMPMLIPDDKTRADVVAYLATLGR